MPRAYGRLLGCLLATFAAAAPVSAAPPKHLIGVRVGSDGIGEFYNVATGQSFTPRGNNFIRLASLPSVFNPGVSNIQHAVLVPGQYNGPQVDGILGTMAAEGYNIVRVFLAPGCTACMGNVQAPGLNPDYIANLVDFLQRAKSHGLEVIFTTDFPPDAGGYLDPLKNEDPAKFGGNNLRYLSAGGVQSDQLFWHDLVQALITANAPTDAIFSYELRNEFAFDGDQPPLSFASGSITAANGQSYDMSDPAAKQQMMQDGMVHWFNTQTDAIKQLDPTALVSSGFFEPQSPNPSRIVNDHRLIQIYPAAAISELDYVSLHPYPGVNLTLPQYVENFGSAAYPKKPLLMEETGAFRQFFPTAQAAADALRQWQVDSCDFNFKGWLLWTYDEPPAQQAPQPMWNAVDDKGQVNQALSPLSRPACLPHNTVTSLSAVRFVPKGPTPSLLASVLASGSGGVVTGSMTFTDAFVPPGSLGGSAAAITVLETIPLQHLRSLAILPPPPLSLGLHFLTAAYGGDGNDSASVSLPLAQVIGNPRFATAATKLTLVSAQPLTMEAEARAPFQFRVTVSGRPPKGRGAVGGKVSLWDGTQLLAAAPLKSGAATLAVQNLAAGPHHIVAVYPGQVLLNGSASAPLDIYIFR